MAGQSAEWSFFCDESGNAGSNYLDAAQPFHVAAGVLIRKAHVPLLEDVVTRLESAGTEIKAARLMKSESGRSRACRLLQAAGGAHALPFFTIYERRFSLAGKILEFFADPATNPRAHWLPLAAKENREVLSGLLLQLLSDNSLAQFAQAHRAPTTEAVTLALETICEDLKLAPTSEELAVIQETLRTAADHIEDICKAEKMDRAGLDHRIWTSLNLPAFTYLLRRADVVLDAYRGGMDVIHDEVSQFGTAMGDWVRSFSAAPHENIDSVTVGGRPMRLAVRNVSTFTTADSAESTGLQLADVLASSVAKLFREMDGDAAWSTATRDLARATLPALMEDHPTFAGFWGSQETKDNFWRRISSL